MTDDAEFARRQIEKYRAAIDRDFEELARLSSGVRHFDQLPNQAGMVDTTEHRRSEKLAHVEMLRDLIRLYERDLLNDGGPPSTSTRAGTGRVLLF